MTHLRQPLPTFCKLLHRTHSSFHIFRPPPPPPTQTLQSTQVHFFVRSVLVWNVFSPASVLPWKQRPFNLPTSLQVGKRNRIQEDRRVSVCSVLLYRLTLLIPFSPVFVVVISMHDTRYFCNKLAFTYFFLARQLMFLYISMLSTSTQMTECPLLDKLLLSAIML